MLLLWLYGSARPHAPAPISDEKAEEVVSEVAASVNETVSETESAVDVLADELERLWRLYEDELAKNGGDSEQACDAVLKAEGVPVERGFDPDSAVFDEYFGRLVDFERSVVVRCDTDEQLTDDDICFSAALDLVFKRNREANPTLAWQTYVSQESGAVRVYPGISQVIDFYFLNCF